MNDNAELVAGLRALADWYEAHPEQPRMYGAFQVFVDTREELISAARALGIAHKTASGDWFWLSHHFGGGVKLQVNIKVGLRESSGGSAGHRDAGDSTGPGGMSPEAGQDRAPTH